MILNRHQIVIALLLVSMGLGAWWYRQSIKPPPASTLAAERRPDYIVEDLRAVAMDAGGMPARRIETPELRHYPDDDSSELRTPVLRVFDENRLAWTVRSETAWVSADGDEVLLQGKVEVHRAARGDAAAVDMRSSELLVMPELDYAETDRFVELESDGDWVTAIDGMQAWLGDEPRTRFFGRTRASFAVAGSGTGADAAAPSPGERGPASAGSAAEPSVGPAAE